MQIGGFILKRIGIYFFCVVAIGCVTSSILYRENEKTKEIQLEKQEKQIAEVKQERGQGESEKLIEVSENHLSGERFLVTEEYGYLVIYDRLAMKQYDETTIRLQDLPKEMQGMVIDGLYFLNEEELYAFLENYSS